MAQPMARDPSVVLTLCGCTASHSPMGLQNARGSGKGENVFRSDYWVFAERRPWAGHRVGNQESRRGTGTRVALRHGPGARVEPMGSRQFCDQDGFHLKLLLR